MQETVAVCKQIQSNDSVYRVIVFESCLMGKGGFGQCYLGYYPFDNSIVLVKKVLKKPDQTNYDFEQKYKKEVTNLALASKKFHTDENSNIVNVYPALIISTRKTHAYIIMQFCRNGDLKKYLQIKEKKGEKLSFGEFYHIFLSILDGYNQLYSAGIIHQDLKPDNIFINNGILKIGDFGLSYNINKSKKVYGGGTQEYNAPEKYKGIVTFASDIYSLGIIFYQIIFGRHPYYQKEQFNEYFKKYGQIEMTAFLKTKQNKKDEKMIRNELFHEFLLAQKMKESLLYTISTKNIAETNCLKSIIKLVESMIRFEPNERPSFQAILQTINQFDKNLKRVELSDLIVKKIPNFKNQIEYYSQASHESIPDSELFFKYTEQKIKQIPSIMNFSEYCQTTNMLSNLLFHLCSAIEHQVKNMVDETAFGVPEALKSFNYCLTEIHYSKLLALLNQFDKKQLQLFYSSGIDYLLNNTKLNVQFLQKQIRSQLQVVNCFELEDIYKQMHEFIMKGSKNIFLNHSNALYWELIIIFLDLLNKGPYINKEQLEQLIKKEKQFIVSKQQIDTLDLSDILEQNYGIKCMNIEI